MINFVYFDLGGVVIKDFSGTNKWSELKKELGITPEKDEAFESIWDKYHNEINLNRDVESLIPILKKELNLVIPENYSFLIDGFVNRFETNKSIWPVIEEVQRNCEIGLLTNMYPGMFVAIKNHNLLPNVTWKIAIDSSVEGIQKPDPEIFKFAQEKSGVRGEEIMFIDNSQTNERAARDFGWQTFLYDSANPEKSSKDLLEFFRDRK